MKFSRSLLLLIPIALALDYFGFSPILVFAISALAIIPLASLMGDATEALAEKLGPTVGGLLNASLGNAPEIIISLFALHRGLVNMVKSSIAGSIIGNLLLGLGLSMFAGGLKVKTQSFGQHVARVNGALLVLASFGLIIPAIFRLNPADGVRSSRHISFEIAIILFLVYVASLIYTLITHRVVVGNPAVKHQPAKSGAADDDKKGAAVDAPPDRKNDGNEAKPGWSLKKALFILAGVTIALAIMSEVLTGALEPAAEKLGLTPLFAGVFLLAVVGNAAELINAVRFALRDKMDLAIGVTVGASTQVALLVAPVLVFAGMAFGQDMNLYFTIYELCAVILAVFMTRLLIYDGESTWLEGLVLIAIYLMLGIGFFHLPAAAVAVR